MEQKANKGAVAVFVKTIAYSPLKTRLAEGIGMPMAMEFYRNSCLCMEEQLQSPELASLFTPFWAVAEAEAISSPEWANFSTLFQGQGGLGERLHTIYSQLMKSYSYVALLGADAPQLDAQHLITALNLLEEAEYVLGPATDGGFYLFLGKKPVPKEVWLSVPYSSEDTCRLLMKELSGIGKIASLEQLSDVDTVEDLSILYDYFSQSSFLAPSQRNLLSWIHQHRSQWD